MRNKIERGFTLVELMVVIVIIGILAAISIPNFVKIIAKSKEAEVRSNMHTVQIEAEFYHVEHFQHYPPDAAAIRPGLPANIKNPFDELGPALQDASDVDIEGVVEYRSAPTQDKYTITGFGKDAVPLNLILTEGV